MRLRPALGAVVLGATFAIAAGSAGSAAAANLYLPSYGTSPEAITGFARAPDGTLAPLPGSPFPLPSTPTGVWAIAFTPDGRRAVANYLFDGGSRGLTVGTDGSIATAGPAFLSPSVTSLAVSPDGRFAYAPTRDFNMVAAVGIIGYSIGADGELTTLGSSPYGSGQVGDVAITPDGRFLYAIAGGIQRFTIAQDGSLTEAGPPTPAPGVGLLTASADGRFLFGGVTSGVGDGVVSYSIAGDGTLSQNGPPALTGDVGLQFFGVSPDGRFVYMPDVNVNGIVTAAVGADGRLTVVGTTPVDDPEAVAISPDSRFLYFARSGAPGRVGVGTIGANGVATLNPTTTPWHSGERQRIVFGPSPAPVASFTSAAGAPGRPSRFDAGGSTGAVRFDWSFGDGTLLPDGGPTPTHEYARAGIYDVRLTVSDAQGCSVRRVYMGQSTACPGGSSAAMNANLDTLPALTRLSVKRKRFASATAAGRRPARVRRGTVFRYRLSEAARVRITIRRRLSGRRVGGRCRPVTRRNRARPRCARFKKVGRIAANGKAGRNRRKFSGKLRGRPLKRGVYRATAVAVDTAGGRSTPRSVRFRIVRLRR